ncbi:unnamed protein product [Acanthoscelides obtectus]|uniref:Uncharacterized protein n=1 Tax=Acanthoscelides obtectus TaxID=200917 RepID=A0A9P0NWR0_ACAOB|nr:unnamed protein product [Acanthoscelides obtectus]CAK1657148.1 hypothetical protein AOBTE_LOCUS20154 [Acanthoscelides obtectus]
MSSFPDRMRPNDLRFEDWARSLMDQDDEDIRFTESDNKLEDSDITEEIHEEDSDADYIPDENETENWLEERNQMEGFSAKNERFYIGKNKF